MLLMGLHFHRFSRTSKDNAGNARHRKLVSLHPIRQLGPIWPIGKSNLTVPLAD